MALRLILDGELLPTREHSDLDDAQITIRRKDSNTTATGYSGTITFSGSAFATVYNKMVADPQAALNVITVNIFDDCCPDIILFRGRIIASQVDYCYYEEGRVNDCTIRASLAEASQESAAYDCLSRIIISDNSRGFRDRKHPFVRYCTTPQPVLSYLVGFLVSVLLSALFGILFTVLSPLIAIIQAVNALCFNCITAGGDPNIFSTLFGFVKNISLWGLGCGSGHPSPYLRDYVQNACDVCGLQFQSSILNDPASPWYNTMYFYAPHNEGTQDNGPQQWAEYWAKNGTIVNALKFLDEIKGAWNADYRVIGNTLILERKDRFTTPQTWVDFTLPENERLLETFCAEFSEDTLPNYVKLEAQFDQNDWIGNTALGVKYTEIVSFEPLPNPNLKGERLRPLPYGAARFNSDGVEPDIIPPAVLAILSFLSAGPVGGIIVLSIILGDDYKSSLLMQGGTCSSPKFLVRRGDGTDSDDNAKVKRTDLGNGTYNYNVEYWPNEDGELYQTYFAYEDPNNSGLSRQINRTYTATFKYSCTDLPVDVSALLSYSLRLPWATGPVVGTIETVTLSGNGRATVTGTI